MDAGCFRSMLEDSPHLASYVLNLHIGSRIPQPRRDSEEFALLEEMSYIYEDILNFCEAEENEEQLARRWRMEEDVIYCLRQLSHLRCLSVVTQHRSLTGKNEPEFISTLKAVASLRSLICLRQYSMFDLLFKQKTHLPYLSIRIGDGGLVKPPEELDSLTQPSSRCRVEFLRVIQGDGADDLYPYSRHIPLGQLLNLEKLQRLFISARGFAPYQIDNVANLLRACNKSLQEFELDLSCPGDNNCKSYEQLYVALGKLHSLRRLHIRVFEYSLTPNPLTDILGIVRLLPKGEQNCLDQISIQTIYLYVPHYPTELTLELWDELWDLVTDLDCFPRLTSLELAGYFGMMEDSERDVVHPDVVGWQAHLVKKQSCSSRLKVCVEILKYGDALDGIFVPSFGPMMGFDDSSGRMRNTQHQCSPSVACQ